MTRNIVAFFIACLAAALGVGLYLRNKRKCVTGVCTVDGKCGCNTGEVCVDEVCVHPASLPTPDPASLPTPDPSSVSSHHTYDITANICGGETRWMDKLTGEVYHINPVIDCVSSKEQYVHVFNANRDVVGAISSHKPSGYTLHFKPEAGKSGYYSADSAVNGSIMWSDANLKDFPNVGVPDTIVWQAVEPL